MQLLDNMIDRAPSGHAVLSQFLPQHLPDLFPADGPTLNQADHHAQIPQHRGRPGRRAGVRITHPGRRLRGRFQWRLWQWLWQWLWHGWHPRKLAITILNAPAFLALLAAIVRDTPLGGLPLAVGFPATKRTPQILTPGIARMGQEENAAMSAAGQAAAQTGMGAQRPTQHKIVFLYQIGHLTASIPIRAKLEKPCNPNC